MDLASELPIHTKLYGFMLQDIPLSSSVFLTAGDSGIWIPKFYLYENCDPYISFSTDVLSGEENTLEVTQDFI